MSQTILDIHYLIIYKSNSKLLVFQYQAHSYTG